MSRMFPWLLAAVIALSAGAARADRDQLVIGITQFPSTLSPVIESMLAKSYVLAMTRRPFVIYDRDWELACMLCVELPTIENGLARVEILADGGSGIALEFAIQPGATWGDGVAVTSADVVFGWEVGKHPETGVADRDFY